MPTYAEVASTLIDAANMISHEHKPMSNEVGAIVAAYYSAAGQFAIAAALRDGLREVAEAVRDDLK